MYGCKPTKLSVSCPPPQASILASPTAARGQTWGSFQSGSGPTGAEVAEAEGGSLGHREAELMDEVRPDLSLLEPLSCVKKSTTLFVP